MTRIYLITFLLTIFLSGCAGLPEETDETKNWSAARFYSEAKSALEGADYETAIKTYEMLEARYPFGRYAQQAQLDIAYAYYKYDEPDSAISACDRFIKLYPRHPNTDYAYYLKGLVNYNRGLGLLQRYLPYDSTQRDPGTARDAFKDFGQLIERYPTSPYREDAKQRMIALRNQLAFYEVHVARYYLKRTAYLAAVNRAQYVVEHFQGTPAVVEALGIMIEAYQLLNLPDLAGDAKRVLVANQEKFSALQADGRVQLKKQGWWERLGLDR